MTHEQQQQFVEFYRRLYWDTSVETGTWELPTIFKDEEELHRNMWKLQLTKILGKTKANSIYYHSWWRRETYLDHVLSWLWLWYWPKVLDYNETVNANN